MWKKVKKKKKKKKKDLTIISKPHAHPRTMKNEENACKFHNNRYKTVRGVALTRVRKSIRAIYTFISVDRYLEISTYYLEIST